MAVPLEVTDERVFTLTESRFFSVGPAERLLDLDENRYYSVAEEPRILFVTGLN